MGDPVIITSLQITDPAQVVAPTRPAPPGLAIAVVSDPAVNADFYARIGGDYGWTDRAGWTAPQWAAFAARVETHVATLDGEPAGYYELDEDGGSAEIRSFGLLEGARGRGVGGHLLVHALRRGFALAPRVWLHTCTLDDPRALPNYEARGLEVFDVRPG